MIGQQRLKDLFELLIKEHDFPRFTILCGPQGSGRKTMCEWIAVTMHKWMSINLYRLPDVKVDTIRQMITSAYQATRTTLYLIQDADTMSLAAKNALLKVTEEPPNNAYFVMTLEDANNTLDTVKSRGSIYWMDNYTSDEILEYAKRNQLTQDEIGIVKAICDVPGDVDNLCKQKPTDFYAYVVKAVDYILMSHLNVILTMDSANMHLASLTNTPVVSIWGATHPYAGFMGWNQSIDNALQSDIDCRPCSIYGNKRCKLGNYPCLNNIKPEQVVEKIVLTLNKQKSL